MSYTFTKQQYAILVEALDVALKKVGLSGIYTIYELTESLNHNRVETADPEVFTYEFEENTVNAFVTVIDIAIKETGLKGGGKLLFDLVEIFEASREDAEAETETPEPQPEAFPEPTA